jgi:hypothetical protein
MRAAPTPSAETIRRARLFWEQSGSDLREAKLALKKGDALHSCYLSLQAATNALSAVCHLHGHFQLPTGGPEQLLLLCAQSDPGFGEAEPCPALEQVREQDPFHEGREIDQDSEIGKVCLGEAEALRARIRRYLKGNRGRFFPP